MKQYLYKTVGKANLFWQELEEVLLDIEIKLNNRPLNYVENDIQFPVLTPNTLAFGEEIFNLGEDINMIGGDLQKRAKYVKKCKDNAWNRWKGEYLKTLRKRHNMRCKKENRPALAIGDVVIIKGEERNGNIWRLEIVIELFKGKDGTVRAAKIRWGISESVNDDEQEQKPRKSKRTAAADAKIKIRDKIEDE